MALIHTNPYLKNERLRKWYVKRSVITSGGVEGIKMASETCKLCKEKDTTPWEMIPELNGHICCPCSYLLCSLENEFEFYKTKALRINNHLNHLKTVTRLIVKRWGK